LDWLRRIIIAPDIHLAERSDRLTIMHSGKITDPEADKSRSHPWTVATSNPTHRYYDLKADPGKIRTSLEDFVELSDWPAIQQFYSLLEWLNGSDSILESSDCKFESPRKNKSLQFNRSLECGGRLMILYRPLHLNTDKANLEDLEDAIHDHLKQIDPGFEWGAVGTTIMRATYVILPVPPKDQAGFQLKLHFWAWGDSEEETMSNLERLFKNLQTALQEVSSEIIETNAGR